ncbi:hypothetical protein NKG05_27125 [Oerskovia sp. M15]
MSSRYRNVTKPPDPAPTIPSRPSPRDLGASGTDDRGGAPQVPGSTPDDVGTEPGAEPERRPMRLVGMHVPGWWGPTTSCPGTEYGFSVDGRPPLPDPRSPQQPHGLLGWSRSFDPDFDWTDDAWTGPEARGAVLGIDVASFTRKAPWMPQRPAWASWSSSVSPSSSCRGSGRSQASWALTSTP